MSATPSCPKCAGARFFHITRVVERGRNAKNGVPGVKPGPFIEWKTRAVGVLRSDEQRGGFLGTPNGRLALRGADVDPVGHFETLVCRGCGHTTWLAFDWQALVSATRPASCRRCAAITPHTQREAVEASTTGYEPVRLTRGMVGREGYVDLDLCCDCGLTTWRARDYLHVTDHWRVHHYADDAALTCLACNATRALVVEPACEFDEQIVPVALHHHKVLGLLETDTRRGSYSLRVCTTCHAIEWYARRLEELENDPLQGVFVLGDAPVTFAEGPYR